MKKILLFATIISIVTIAGLNCNSSSPTEIKYDNPVILSEVTYLPSDKNEGVYPCKAVLDNDNNPYKNVLMSNLKWSIQSTTGNFAAKYYSWATCLAQDPNGESQYYTAMNLKDIANKMSTETSKDSTFKDSTQKRAVRAYYSVLVNFPDARGYDITGKISWSLLPMCVAAIKQLGGNPSPYVNVKTAGGDSTTIIQLK